MKWKNSCHSCESKPSSFIWVVVESFFLKQKWKNSNMHNFNHHGSFVSVKVSNLAKVPTPCFYVSQGFDTLPRFLHLVSYESRFPHLAKVSTPCFYVSQGSHTLFLCESRFPHLAKVPTPCFYMSQGFHILSRFPHLVSIWVKVSPPC